MLLALVEHLVVLVVTVAVQLLEQYLQLVAVAVVVNQNLVVLVNLVDQVVVQLSIGVGLVAARELLGLLVKATTVVIVVPLLILILLAEAVAQVRLVKLGKMVLVGALVV